MTGERAATVLAGTVSASAIGHQIDPETVVRISLALGRLNRLLRRSTATGLGPGSVSALATLVSGGSMRLGDLAAREGVAPPTMTRIVSALEENGFITRVPDPADRRASLVTATASAVEEIRGLGDARRSELLARLEALPEAEREALLAAVPALELLSEDG